MATLSPKDPDSEEWFNWDFTRLIQSGAGGTIASIVAGPLKEDGDDAVTVLVGPAISPSGLLVSAKLGGGTSETRYQFTMRVLTTAGETLDHTLSFSCVNAVT